MRQTSAQGPSRLRRAPQLAVDPLLGHPALHLCPGSATENNHPAKSVEERLRARIPAATSLRSPPRLYLRHGHTQARLAASVKRYQRPNGCALAQPQNSARIVAAGRAGCGRSLNRHAAKTASWQAKEVLSYRHGGGGARGNKKQDLRSAPIGAGQVRVRRMRTRRREKKAPSRSWCSWCS